jgi:hypothetical protein
MELLDSLLPFGLLMVAFLLLFTGAEETAPAVKRAGAHGSSAPHPQSPEKAAGRKTDSHVR